jgi:hypothetical protein
MRFLIIVAILLVIAVYRIRRSGEIKIPAADLTNDQIKRKWRELGFFCELDNEKRAWTLTGSRTGLLSFRDLLLKYVADPRNEQKGEQRQYGPYGTLDLMTWPDPGFDGHVIRGSFADFKRLAGLVETKIGAAQPGAVVRIRDEYSADSPYALLLDVRADGFDPAFADRERLGGATIPEPTETSRKGK